MPELIDFDRQDLVNISKVLDVFKSDRATYEKDGKMFSMTQNNQYGYRIKLKNSNKTILLIFKLGGNKLLDVLEYEDS